MASSDPRKDSVSFWSRPPLLSVSTASSGRSDGLFSPVVLKVNVRCLSQTPLALKTAPLPLTGEIEPVGSAHVSAPVKDV